MGNPGAEKERKKKDNGNEKALDSAIVMARRGRFKFG
jgi:hypothetical protein